MIPNQELFKILTDLGGAVMITVLLMIFSYKLFIRFGEAFIRAQQDIAKAMEQQALCMSELKDNIHDFVSKDGSVHREVLLTLQVIGEEMKRLERMIEEIHNS